MYSTNMKVSLCILISLSLYSCAAIDSNNVAPGYKEAFTSIKQLIVGVDNSIDPELIKNIPYASMLVKIGKGPWALMILEKATEEGDLWVSADGVYFLIDNGRIIQTHGLNNNLKEKLSSSITWNDKVIFDNEYVSYHSYSQPTLNNLKVLSGFLDKEEVKVDLIFGPKKLRLIEEVIYSSEIGWNEKNLYWVDKSNFVWKSSQSISPRLPTIHFEVTKKPR